MNETPLVLLLAWLGYLLSDVLKTAYVNSRPITINVMDPPAPPTLNFHAPTPPPQYYDPGEDDDDEDDDDDDEPEAPPPTDSSPEKRPESEPIHNRLFQHLN